jgi:hypothetical protein
MISNVDIDNGKTYAFLNQYNSPLCGCVAGHLILWIKANHITANNCLGYIHNVQRPPPGGINGMLRLIVQKGYACIITFVPLTCFKLTVTL